LYFVQTATFQLIFHDPVARISGNLRTLISQTSVTIGQDGFLKVEILPDMPINQAADIQTTLLEDENYSSQEQFKNGHWDQNFDIWINIVDSLVTLPPTLQWDANYGGDARYAGSAVVQTSDGGYAIVGKIDNKYTADVVVLVRADSTGKMQWNRTCDFLLNAARARFLESNIPKTVSQ